MVSSWVELGDEFSVCLFTNVLHRRVFHGHTGNQLTLEHYVVSTEAASVEVVELLFWLAGVDVVLILPAYKKCLVRL